MLIETEWQITVGVKYLILVFPTLDEQTSTKTLRHDFENTIYRRASAKWIRTDGSVAKLSSVETRRDFRIRNTRIRDVRGNAVGTREMHSQNC